MTILRPQVNCILFDLDDTLYQNETMRHDCAERIRRYMVEKLDIPADEVAEKCADYYLTYGTTLAGLVAHGYHIDYDDWHADVHGAMPYEEYLQPDPALRRMLDSIPIPKFIFTNADAKHTARCLDLLGITDCFQGIICFESVMEAAEKEGLVHHGRPVVCKPNRLAFDIALKQAGGDAQASTTLWLDDSARNVTTGHKMGMYSVLVGRTGIACPADQQIRDIHELPSALPWLWQGMQPPAVPAPAADGKQAKHQGVADGAGGLGEEEEPVAVVSGPQEVGFAAKAVAKSSGVRTSTQGEIEAVHVAAG